MRKDRKKKGSPHEAEAPAPVKGLERLVVSAQLAGAPANGFAEAGNGNGKPAGVTGGDGDGAGESAKSADWQKNFFIRHRLATARIPRRFWNKTLDNFRARDVMRRRLVQDAQRFIGGFNFEKEFPQGLRMIGPVGCGKSHLAAAILSEVVGKGYSGLFYNSPDLLRDIRATFNNEGLTEDDLLEEITMVDLLVLDDVGAEKISDFVLDRFYLIVNKRYEECKPMIVTTNLDEETLRNRLGERTVSRLIEMCQEFGPFPEEDFRRKMMASG